MVEKGDVDNRRDQYIKSICLSLHGQTRRRSHQARPDEAQQLWPTIPSAQNPGSKPVSAGNINNGEELRLQEDPSLRDPWLPMKSDGTPRFSAVYWNEYFKLYPDKIPRRGDTMEECKAILDAFVGFWSADRTSARIKDSSSLYCKLTRSATKYSCAKQAITTVAITFTLRRDAETSSGYPGSPHRGLLKAVPTKRKIPRAKAGRPPPPMTTSIAVKRSWES